MSWRWARMGKKHIREEAESWCSLLSLASTRHMGAGGELCLQAFPSSCAFILRLRKAILLHSVLAFHIELFYP